MSELKTPQELGTEKIGKLLIRYAVPAMIAMLASSLYNIVDRAFIGHGVGPMALSGLAVTFPLMNLSAALGSMVGVGSGTMISLKLGQKDHKSAQMLLGNSVTMNILIGLLFGVFSLIFIDPILRVFGATDVTIGYAREYMVIILAGNAFTHLYLGINCILRAAGHPNKAMVATIGTVLLNTLLDYLFIMVFHWGIKGAAIATVISQVLAFIWQCFQLSDKSELIHLQRGTYRLRGDLVKNIVTIGLSPCLMNAAACFVVLLINRGLLKYGSDVAIGAYSIVNSFGFLIVMMVMGFNQAMQPIAGYNYGAKLRNRMFSVLWQSIFWAEVVMTLGWLAGLFLPEQMARLFTTDADLIEQSAHAIRLNQLAFPLIGCQAVMTNFFQSLGKARISIMLSLSRQLFFLVPLLVVLPHYFGTDGVWYALPLSDAIAFAMTAVVAWVELRKL